MTRNELYVRIFFLAIVLIIAVFLAFRPIPSMYSPNDTGRYIYNFTEQSSKPFFNSDISDWSWWLFNTILRPISLFENDHVFMFVTVLIIPLAFFFFGKWGRAGLLWSLAVIFSMIGFELATNALRQAMGIFFLLFAIRLILDDKKIPGLLLGGLSMFLHVSNILFFPLLLWLTRLEYQKDKKQYKKNNKNIFLGALLIVLLVTMFTPIGTSLLEFLTLRQTFYVEQSSPAFLIFLALPIFYIYFIRKIFAPFTVSDNEKATLIYSIILIIISLIFFPAIVYRIVFTSFVLQIFMALAANNSNNKQGFYVLSGMIFQLILYFILSPNPMEVLFG